MDTPKVAELDEMASRLPIDDQRSLAERITRRVRAADPGRGPKVLRGRFAADVKGLEGVDVMAMIREIRDQWKEDFEEFGS